MFESIKSFLYEKYKARIIKSLNRVDLENRKEREFCYHYLFPKTAIKIIKEYYLKNKQIDVNIEEFDKWVRIDEKKGFLFSKPPISLEIK